jgi:hypothetical protein
MNITYLIIFYHNHMLVEIVFLMSAIVVYGFTANIVNGDDDSDDE